MIEPQLLKRQQPATPPSQLYADERFAPAPSGLGEDEISLLEIWQVLVRYKWIIAASVLLLTSVAGAYAFFATPVYRAEVLMVSVQKDGQQGGLAALAGQFGGLASMVGVDVGGGGSPAIAMATLKSRTFTQDFIKEQNMLPVLFDADWDAAKKDWKSSDPEKIPGMWAAYKVFDGMRHVAEDRKTGLITLAIEWKDPVLASLWAMQLVDRINKLLRENAVAEVERNLSFLRKQLEHTDVLAVQQSLSALIEAEMKKAMLANVNEDYAFQVVDPAIAPEEKVRPRRGLIIVVGVFLGCLLGVFIAFVMNLIRR